MVDHSDWQSLRSSAIARRHSGDIQGAVDDLTKAIGLSRAKPQLAERTATMLNYLADVYLECNALGEAEAAIRESIELSRPGFPGLLAANLCGLAEILSRKGEHREALGSAEEARQLYQQQGHSYGVGQAEELIGRIRPNVG